MATAGKKLSQILLANCCGEIDTGPGKEVWLHWHGGKHMHLHQGLQCTLLISAPWVGVLGGEVVNRPRARALVSSCCATSRKNNLVSVLCIGVDGRGPTRRMQENIGQILCWDLPSCLCSAGCKDVISLPTSAGEEWHPLAIRCKEHPGPWEPQGIC